MVGILESDLDGSAVDLLQRALLAVNGEPRRLGGYQLLVVIHVLIPELEVVRCERCTVRPLHALAQVQRELSAIIGDFPALYYVRTGIVAGVVPEQHVVRTSAAAIAVPLVRRTGESAPQNATVLAGLVERLQHHQVFALTGKPILDGRKLACRRPEPPAAAPLQTMSGTGSHQLLPMVPPAFRPSRSL